jgi:hypothetical protein
MTAEKIIDRAALAVISPHFRKRAGHFRGQICRNSYVTMLYHNKIAVRIKDKYWRLQRIAKGCLLYDYLIDANHPQV